MTDVGWQAVGMGATGSVEVLFDDAQATAIGNPGDYLQRPGFWQGGIGIAACWYGAACSIAERLRERESLLRSIRDDAPAAPAVPVAPEPEPEPVRAPEPEPVAVAAPAPEPPAPAPAPVAAPVASAPAAFDPRRALGRWLGAPEATSVGVKELPALVSANPAIRGCALVDDEGLALSSTLPAGVSDGSLGALATRIFQLLSQSALEVGMEPRDQVLATFGEHTLLITRAKPFLIVTLHASPAVSASLQRRLQRIARALVAAETAG